MLKQRIITALVLLALLLPALWAPVWWPFSLLCLVAVTAAGWEWGRLNQAGGVAFVLAGAVAVACGLAWSQGWVTAAPKALWWISAAAWLVAGPVALRGGPSAWPAVPRTLRWLIGVAALTVAWVALGQAKMQGINFLLSIFCLVWAADIAAYFGGRAFGRRKLAPSISPGKSWEGVWSGGLGVLVLAAVWVALERHLAPSSPSLFSLLHARWGWLGTVPALVVLSGMSVVGDLFESLVKRAAGAKDSSRLLPGHGGVLDRVDALLPVFPIALAFTAGL